MTTQSIINATFQIKNQHQEAYSLVVDFEVDGGAHQCTPEVQFIQEDRPNIVSTYDIATVNGTTEKRKISHFIRNLHVAEISHTFKAIEGIARESEDGRQMVFVLDLRHKEGGYGPAMMEDITACENVVMDFLKEKDQASSTGGAATGFRKQLREHKITHVIREGSLKSFLIENTGFSDQQIDFLLTKPDGRLVFCQFAEFFMNAFKLGQIARCSGGLFQGTNFVHGIENNAPLFKSAKRSVVFFPPEYDGVEEGRYAQTMRASGVFDLDSTVYPETKDHPGKITEVAITRREI